MDQAWQVEERYELEYDDPYEAASAVNQSGGCLTAILPPLAVLIVGCLLAFFALNLTTPVVADTGQAEMTITEQTTNDSVSEEKPVENKKTSEDRKSPKKLAALFTPEVLYWEDLIVKWARQFDLDPNLVATVMQIESCGDPEAISSAGASGLFQVMPFHFAAGENMFDPQINAKRGVAYLQKAFQAREGDARLALASYNGGISGASRPESQWANETQRYAYWGEGIYQDAINEKKNSSRLNEWLSAGGASLCAQAARRLGITP
jgi:soluble lytic murein transglycosylase-like protein